MTVEDLNMMYIPAGHQIKIELELNKLKKGAGMMQEDFACGTDDLEDMMINNPNIVCTSVKKEEAKEEKKEVYNPGKHIDD